METCPKCGSNTVRNLGWVWKPVATFFLVMAVIELLVAALVPAAEPVWSYKTIYGGVMNLFFAGFIAYHSMTIAPRWRCRTCKHTWR
jgi:FtsH-binding integral membrane protein